MGGLVGLVVGFVAGEYLPQAPGCQAECGSPYSTLALFLGVCAGAAVGWRSFLALAQRHDSSRRGFRTIAARRRRMSAVVVGGLVLCSAVLVLTRPTFGPCTSNQLTAIDTVPPDGGAVITPTGDGSTCGAAYATPDPPTKVLAYYGTILGSHDWQPLASSPTSAWYLSSAAYATGSQPNTYGVTVTQQDGATRVEVDVWQTTFQ